MTSADSTMALQTLSPIPVKGAPSFRPDNEDAASVDSFHLQLSDDEDGAKKGAKEEAEEEEILNRDFDKVDSPGPEDEDKLLNGDGTEEESGSETKRCASADTNGRGVSERGEKKHEDSVSASVERSEKKNEEEKDEKGIEDAGKDGGDNDVEMAEEKKDEENADLVDGEKDVVKQSISDGDEKDETKNEESVSDDADAKESPKEAPTKIEEEQQVAEEAEKEEKHQESDVAKATEQNKDGAKVEGCEALAEETNEAATKQPEPSQSEEAKQASESSQPEPEKDQEILNGQVMDPEDLLQMVDKETDENDKDSSQNSPQNAEEASETEKMDVDDAAKAAEEAQDEKDEVDIDEDSSMESDTEIDKEYESLAEEEIETDLEVKQEEKGETKEEAKVKEEKVNASKEPADVAMEASEAETTEEAATKETEATNEEIKSERETITDGAANKSDRPSSPVIILDEVTGETKTNATVDEDKERTSSKRSLSDPDEEAAAKKMKVQDEPAKEGEKAVSCDPNLKIVALNAIDEYLKLKSLKKLTYRDLEQIILQKMCEAICHKSEIGELRHQLGVQEQMAEMWRKEVAQLTKQARDLEIVNKRLLHEVRLKNERDKPLIPVKITRSVGLQVRSDSGVMNNVMNNKRKVTRPPNATAAKQTRTITPNRTQSVTRVAPQNKIITPTKATAARASPAKVPVSPVKKASPAKPPTLLSKALSTCPTSTTTATTSSTASTTPTITQISIPSLTAITTTTKAVTTTTKTTKALSDSKTVIDLTDEDDKKATTSQGIRIVPTAVKSANVVTTAGVVNPPRIMYVYNNQLHQGVLAADPNKPGQKLMLKLNSNVIAPANGVIAAAVSTGSAIAVSSSSIRPTSVQPVKIASSSVAAVRGASPANKVKHPAPLPHPPPNQYCVPSRKPIPPKPHLSIKRSNGGLVLSWKMPYNLENYEAIASYQLYAYQETTSPPNSDMWRKVGDVKALALPMACTLTQFADGNKYHFAVRAVDVLKRLGPFSDPEQILL